MDEYRRFDELMQKSLSHIVGCPVTPDALLQASLPPSLGGLGITSAELIAPAAYVASCLILKPLGPGPLGICLPHPEVVSLLDLLNDAMVPGDRILADSVTKLGRPQDVLYSKLFKIRSHTLKQRSSGLDLARLESVSGPHSGDFLHVVPSPALGFLMGSAEYSAGLRMRLGLPTNKTDGCLCLHAAVSRFLCVVSTV
jgi:hypothetical protein